MNFIIIIFFPFIIFFIGIIGLFLNRKNILLVIICIELILLSINFFFLISSYYLDDNLGQLFVIFILVVASAESSIGLAILITYYRVHGNITAKSINFLKG
jgi:NADH:ubiquinone oxidoreductase subunit K